jgi:hypothetical protein
MSRAERSGVAMQSVVNVFGMLNQTLHLLKSYDLSSTVLISQFSMLCAQVGRSVVFA